MSCFGITFLNLTVDVSLTVIRMCFDFRKNPCDVSVWRVKGCGERQLLGKAFTHLRIIHFVSTRGSL